MRRHVAYVVVVEWKEKPRAGGALGGRPGLSEPGDGRYIPPGP